MEAESCDAVKGAVCIVSKAFSPHAHPLRPLLYSHSISLDSADFVLAFPRYQPVFGPRPPPHFLRPSVPIFFPLINKTKCLSPRSLLIFPQDLGGFVEGEDNS